MLGAFLKEINLEMITCPSGIFMMGSPSTEMGRLNNEFQHKVSITSPFKIGKYPVTQTQFQSIMGYNPSKFRGASNPVECVSWDDAKEFCEKLNKQFGVKLLPGYKFDLPTEAQWEYACRAGTDTAFNCGKEMVFVGGLCSNLDEIAWYYRNSGDKTHPVGLKQPNAWGIYDMHGNVCEWCRDWYGNYSRTDVRDPLGSLGGFNRIVRGGGWYYDVDFCRSAFRSKRIPSRGNFLTGFRVAFVPIEEY